MAGAEAGSETLETLQRQLAKRLGPQVGVACTGVDGDPASLYPEEQRAVERAIPRRQREYAAGRSAARQAMMAIGWPASSVPMAADRSPVWPVGLAGSISHSRRGCVAVVARRSDVDGVGVDLEDGCSIESALWATICTPDELAMVRTQAESLRGLAVACLFSAKEAVYKWQHPLTGRMLDFQDVRVALDARMQNFVARIAAEGPSAALGPVHASGHILHLKGHMVAWVLSRANT